MPIRNPMMAALLLMPMAAMAAEKSSPPTVNDMDKIQEETLVLQAKANLAAAAADLANKSGVTASQPDVLPKVVAVYGQTGSLRAELVLADGARQECAEGDAFYGDSYKVATITPGRVVATDVRKKKSILLAFLMPGEVFPKPASATMGSSGAAIPNLPPMPVPASKY